MRKLDFPAYYTADEMRSDAQIAKGFLEYLLTPTTMAEVEELKMSAYQTHEANREAFVLRLKAAGWNDRDAATEWRRIQMDEESGL